MKKVILAKEMARIEQLAYNETDLEEQFMRTAAAKIAEVIQKTVAELHISPNIGFLIGKGNNGGDGLLAAKILSQGGFGVKVYCFAENEESSPLNQLMRRELENDKIPLVTIHSLADFTLGNEKLLIDALFGTGFKGTLPPFLQAIIVKIKERSIPVLSIDIPSGINGDFGKKNDAIVAYKTLFLGAAKWGCFLEDAYDHLGTFEILNFGLPENYLQQAELSASLFTFEDAKQILPPIQRTRHKYQAGYVLGIGGSKSMPGAAILSSMGSLRVGAGMVRLFHPKEMGATSYPSIEIIKEELTDSFERFEEEQKRAKAIFIGPGMGRDEKAIQLIKRVLPIVEKPVVLDADALFLIAKNQIAFPPYSILTPHQQEMEYLLDNKKFAYSEFLIEVQRFTDEKKCILVLKGAPTRIFRPEKEQVIITEGDSGMATAGTGDVLTGVIAGFLAQGLEPLQAALLGVFVHGVAGSLGAKELTSYSLIASDLLLYIPKAIMKIQQIPGLFVF